MNKPRILVVDDILQNRKVIIAYLQMQEYDILEAADGETCLEIIAGEPVDLVLLDVMMPGLNGYEVCRKLKGHLKTQFLPVVLVTALESKEEKIKGIEAGADDFLTKPVDKNELLTRIKSLLRIKKLYEELEKSLEKQKELRRFKEDLSGMIVHDMNNLLTGLAGNIQMMMLENDKLPPEVREDLADAQRSLKGLISMVSDFLDITRLEENKMKLSIERVDITGLIENAVRAVMPVCNMAGINLKTEFVENNLSFEIDSALLSRVIINLLMNSIKFTPKEGQIKISAALETAGLKISVQDTGSGIPPEFREKIFKKYSQLELKELNLKRGRGLGLTFCKLAVEAHSGKIWVESAGLNKGSTFIFTIPIKK